MTKAEWNTCSTSNEMLRFLSESRKLSSGRACVVAEVARWLLRANLYATPPASTTYSRGAHDAFITAFNAGGGSLAWSTYLGGLGDDTAAGLALDLDNNVYVI